MNKVTQANGKFIIEKSPITKEQESAREKSETDKTVLKAKVSDEELYEILTRILVRLELLESY